MREQDDDLADQAGSRRDGMTTNHFAIKRIAATDGGSRGDLARDLLEMYSLDRAAVIFGELADDPEGDLPGGRLLRRGGLRRLTAREKGELEEAGIDIDDHELLEQLAEEADW